MARLHLNLSGSVDLRTSLLGYIRILVVTANGVEVEPSEINLDPEDIIVQRVFVTETQGSTTPNSKPTKS